MELKNIHIQAKNNEKHLLSKIDGKFVWEKYSITNSLSFSSLEEFFILLNENSKLKDFLSQYENRYNLVIVKNKQCYPILKNDFKDKELVNGLNVINSQYDNDYFDIFGLNAKATNMYLMTKKLKNVDIFKPDTIPDIYFISISTDLISKSIDLESLSFVLLYNGQLTSFFYKFYDFVDQEELYQNRNIELNNKIIIAVTKNTI